MRTRARAEPIDFDSAAAAFCEGLRLRRCSSSLQKQARRVLEDFSCHLRRRGLRRLASVKEPHLAGFARRLEGRGLSAASRAAYLGLLQRFFAFLHSRGAILLDPAQHLPLPRVEGLPRPTLSEAQARALLESPPRTGGLGKRDRALLELLYGTGIRRAECLRAELSDLDLAERTLLVRNGKGRRDRVVPIPARAAQALEVYLREARPAFLCDPRQARIFLTWQGKGLSPETLLHLVRAYGREAGIPGRVSPHALRRACATHLLRGGADVRHVQAILGHQDIDTTVRYTRVERQDLREVLERSHPRARARPEAG